MSAYTRRTSDWRHAAACREEDPELFFPLGHSGTWLHVIDEAKAVCHRCPVRENCLQWALETGEQIGVYGGLTEQERRALKRRPARPISVDDYTGTSDARQPVNTLEEAWKLYTHTDGDHILWIGPKVIHLAGQQQTPNRIAFQLGRGRQPEGDTKRTCDLVGCVKPAHLADRTERSQGDPGDILRTILDQNTVASFDGHLDWTGPGKTTVQGREYTPRQVAFIVGRGRLPQGSVRTGCVHRGCVASAHLNDAEERGTCGTRNGYLWHRKRGEDVCGPCKAANVAYNRARRTGAAKQLAVAV